jgi:hypothetical protein
VESERRRELLGRPMDYEEACLFRASSLKQKTGVIFAHFASRRCSRSASASRLAILSHLASFHLSHLFYLHLATLLAL